jgi:hypothetical protein
MTTRAYVIVVVGALIAISLILRQVRRRRLRGKYALMWMLVGVGLVLLAVIPGALDRLGSVAGVAYPPALLLVMGLGFFAFLSLHFSVELTRLEERTRVLAEETALLNERLTRSGDDERRAPHDDVGRSHAPSAVPAHER